MPWQTEGGPSSQDEKLDRRYETLYGVTQLRGPTSGDSAKNDAKVLMRVINLQYRATAAYREIWNHWWLALIVKYYDSGFIRRPHLLPTNGPSINLIQNH